MSTQETFNAIYREAVPVADGAEQRPYRSISERRASAHGLSRAPRGSIKRTISALKVGDTIEAQHEATRNAFNVVARRLKMRLKSNDGVMTRIA